MYEMPAGGHCCEELFLKSVTRKGSWKMISSHYQSPPFRAIVNCGFEDR